MDFSQSNAQDPTPEELKKLDNLKKLIEQAVSDGVVDGEEVEAIKREILGHRQGSAEQIRRELDLYNTLVVQKIQSGDLEYGA
jgi:uncharacterized membrane protein YebE (DUF533 family)